MVMKTKPRTKIPFIVSSKKENTIVQICWAHKMYTIMSAWGKDPSRYLRATSPRTPKEEITLLFHLLAGNVTTVQLL
jgi:hypothetical protein